MSEVSYTVQIYLKNPSKGPHIVLTNVSSEKVKDLQTAAPDRGLNVNYGPNRENSSRIHLYEIQVINFLREEPND